MILECLLTADSDSSSASEKEVKDVKAAISFTGAKVYLKFLNCKIADQHYKA